MLLILIAQLTMCAMFTLWQRSALAGVFLLTACCCLDVMFLEVKTWLK